MTLREKIEVMEAFERGEEIECITIGYDTNWQYVKEPSWNWREVDYRVKPKPKPTITIEKWLFEDRFGIKFLQDIEKDCVLCYCHEFQTTKVKLLDTYEVEL